MRKVELDAAVVAALNLNSITSVRAPSPPPSGDVLREQANADGQAGSQQTAPETLLTTVSEANTPSPVGKGEGLSLPLVHTSSFRGDTDSFFKEEWSIFL